MREKIYTLINKKTFFIDVDPFENKDQLFDKCSHWLLEAGLITNTADFKKHLYAREDLGSTYMGNYIALPHARGDSIKREAVLFCRTNSPFVYTSGDEIGEVKYIFMILVPAEISNGDYMKTLSSLATALMKKEFLDRLETINTYQEFVDNFVSSI